jgi:hypothetical protein
MSDTKSKLAEVEKKITALARARDAYLVKFRAEIDPLLKVRDQLAAEVEAERMVERMSNTERAALAHVISTSTVPSTSAVGTPGKK